MNKSGAVTFLFLLTMLALQSCTSPMYQDPSDPSLNITVSILPEKYFVERIGGEHISVNVMVGPGDSPHSYEPKAAQMTALSKSAVYFQIGVEFEDAWMERIRSANPEMLVVDLSQNIKKLETASVLLNGSESDPEENRTDHNHQTLDPHVWTSLENGVAIAQVVYETLVTLDPQHTQDYRTNLDGLIDDIGRLQSEIRSSLKNINSHKFMVFHPAWSYFADEFGLEQIPVEVGGTEPGAQELASLITEAKAEGIQVIFAQPEFSTRSAEYIASEIGGTVILISPLEENWLENLSMVAKTIAGEL